MHPWLTGLHSLWVKEHNRIAKGLATLNPEWNSDRLFHDARRIVIAELQHITYKHYLTALTGKKLFMPLVSDARDSATGLWGMLCIGGSSTRAS